MMRWLRWSAIILLALMVSAGAVGAQDVIGPDIYPEGVNPLTGLPVLQPENLERRPLIVKIDNYPAEIRPQSGVGAADMVWETLLAGGVTRFAAIYLSEDFGHVGPVRSCRLADFELTRVYRSLFACSGMAQGTLDRLRADALATSRSISRGGPCPPLCRFPRDGVAFEHTLFGDLAGLRDLAVEMGRDTSAEPLYGMAFSEEALNGVSVNSVRVAYNQTEIEWDYSEFSEQWMRSQDGEAHYDALTGTQIGAVNVLILEADHIEQPFVSEGYWGPPNFAFTVNLLGRGRVFLLRDGQYVEGEWRRERETDPLTYFDRDGNTLLFKPGNTFVNLVPRWVNGYQLAFALDEPLTATVSYPDGVYLRQGPGSGYSAIHAAQRGDTFPAIGRNRAGDWIQLLLPDGGVVWGSATILSLDGDVVTLPFSRSTYE